jgi:hypothetical protein
MWRCVGLVLTDVSEERIASIIVDTEEIRNALEMYPGNTNLTILDGWAAKLLEFLLVQIGHGSLLVNSYILATHDYVPLPFEATYSYYLHWKQSI